MIPKHGIQIIDVREKTDYDSGHLHGALNVPITKLETTLSDVQADRPVVLMCAEGYRSSTAASMLARKGFLKIHSVAGGMSAWIAAGFAVEETST